MRFMSTLCRSALVASVASIVLVSAFGTATASDRFSTQADSRQAKTGQEIIDGTASEAPKYQSSGSEGYGAGVTSASDQAQSANLAYNAEAEQVRQELVQRNKSLQSQISSLQSQINSLKSEKSDKGHSHSSGSSGGDDSRGGHGPSGTNGHGGGGPGGF